MVGKELEKNPLRPLAVTFTKKNNAHARKKKTEGGEQGETQGYKNARAGRLGGERRGCGRAGRTQSALVGSPWLRPFRFTSKTVGVGAGT